MLSFKEKKTEFFSQIQVLLAPLLDVMVFFSELSEALLVSLVLEIVVTCRFAALNTYMKFEVLSLELE
jgi:hypothetical protein